MQHRRQRYLWSRIVHTNIYLIFVVWQLRFDINIYFYVDHWSFMSVTSGWNFIIMP